MLANTEWGAQTSIYSSLWLGNITPLWGYCHKRPNKKPGFSSILNDYSHCGELWLPLWPKNRVMSEGASGKLGLPLLPTGNEISVSPLHPVVSGDHVQNSKICTYFLRGSKWRPNREPGLLALYRINEEISLGHQQRTSEGHRLLLPHGSNSVTLLLLLEQFEENTYNIRFK